MKAVWLVPPAAAEYAKGKTPEKNLLQCPVASVRMRLGVAALKWKQEGHENVFIEPTATNIDSVADAADICIVSKFYHHSDLHSWIDICRVVKARGKKLVVDVCDNPLPRPGPIPTFYTEAMAIANAVAVNSERMAELMEGHCRRPPLIIEDALLSPMQPPKFAPTTPLRVLWFGHPMNVEYLNPSLHGLRLLAEQRPLKLILVTLDGCGVKEWTQKVSAPGFSASFVPFSIEAQAIALQHCDVVLIPSDPGDMMKAGASSNRLVETINAGRLAVASPLPSYLPFADGAWIGKNLPSAIAWSLEHPSIIVDGIKRGQELIRGRFTPEKIGKEWTDLFRSLAEGR
jgi:hypothetical protein